MESDSSNSLESEGSELSTQIENSDLNTGPSDNLASPQPDNDSYIEPEEPPSNGGESTDPSLDGSDSVPVEHPSEGGESPEPSQHHKSVLARLIKFISNINLYLSLFVLIIIIGVFITIVSYLESKNSSTTTNINSKSLSAGTLAQLANTNATVGSNGQILNVESSAVFAGQVLVRQGLDVAGNLNVGGTLVLNSIAVTGSSQFSQTNINKGLSVAGDSNFQGNTTVNKDLQVGGSGTFSGDLSAPQLTTSSLQLNGDLILNHHLTASGSTPSRTNGEALGSGGTSSVSGSDTAGSIAINTGSNAAAGCFMTINFSSPFSAIPHVIVTPIGANAGGLSYYVNRNTTSFSVCDDTAPPANASFGFDYFVVG
jgi:cytoskeletal protein CcmA (bactofilin family)